MMFFNKNSGASLRGSAAQRGAAPLSPRFARLVRESIWFAIVAVLAYVALILASYSPGDPAWSYSGDGSPIVNRGGAIGAWLADLLLYLFGISAWWLVVAGVAITIASFRRIAHPELETDHPRWLGTIGFALVLVASSAIEALRFWKLGATLPIGPGGAIGDALGSMLTRGLGYNGATLLLVAAFLGGFSLFSGLSWLKLMERIGAALEGLVAWARRKREERLDRRIVFQASDLVSYSPATERRVGGEGMTMGEICAAAMTLSDNTAGNLLLASFGGPAGLTAYARSLGDPVTRLDRIETALNEAAPGDPRDTTTPAAMLDDLCQLVLGPALSEPSRAQLVAWLLDNRTGARRLRAGFPAEWRVGDKTGTGDNGAAADVAMVWRPERTPLAVAVYWAESDTPFERRNQLFEDVARILAAIP